MRIHDIYKRQDWDIIWNIINEPCGPSENRLHELPPDENGRIHTLQLRRWTRRGRRARRPYLEQCVLCENSSPPELPIF